MDDYFDDDSIDDGDSFEDIPDGDMENDDSLNEEMQDVSDNDDTLDIGWKEIAMFGALSEQIAEEERERLRIERDMSKDEDKENM